MKKFELKRQITSNDLLDIQMKLVEHHKGYLKQLKEKEDQDPNEDPGVMTDKYDGMSMFELYKLHPELEIIEKDICSVGGDKQTYYKIKTKDSHLYLYFENGICLGGNIFPKELDAQVYIDHLHEIKRLVFQLINYEGVPPKDLFNFRLEEYRNRYGCDEETLRNELGM